MDLGITVDDGFPLAEYQRIPISFEARSVFEVIPPPDGGFGLVLRERPVEPPFIKDYDQPGHRPTDWPTLFNLANWGIFVAHSGESVAGGAVVAWNTSEVNLLEDRQDLSVLWDIRVRPAERGRGVGAALFEAAAAWSRSRGVIGMKIETQSINVAACRFYASRGCTLSEINTRAYPDLPHETQLIWFLKL